MLKSLLLVFLFISLSANENSWYSKIDTRIEAGILLLDTGGDISNTTSISSFRDDLGYMKLKSSYLGVEILVNYDYMPNLHIDYFNLSDNKDEKLTKTIKIADGTFETNSSVSTDMKYEVYNAILYQDFKIKGKVFSIFSKNYYTGDIEFDAGINTKKIHWKFNIQDSWIRVDKLIFLPYLGFKYYLYNLIVYGEVSALAFNRAESTAYQAGIEYNVVDRLYLVGGYFYEDFEVLEKKDTVNFNSSGYKLSFKYSF